MAGVQIVAQTPASWNYAVTRTEKRRDYDFGLLRDASWA